MLSRRCLTSTRIGGKVFAKDIGVNGFDAPFWPKAGNFDLGMKGGSIALSIVVKYRRSCLMNTSDKGIAGTGIDGGHVEIIIIPTVSNTILGGSIASFGGFGPNALIDEGLFLCANFAIIRLFGLGVNESLVGFIDLLKCLCGIFAIALSIGIRVVYFGQFAKGRFDFAGPC